MNIDLKKIAEKYQQSTGKLSRRIVLCGGTGCVANGALKVRDALVEALKASNLDVVVEIKSEEGHKHDNAIYVSKSGCQGFCQQGPLMHIEPEHILYTKVKASDVPAIVEKTLKNGEIIEELLYANPRNGERCKGNAEIPFQNRQHRMVMKNCMIEPENINEYIARGGYEGARKAVQEMTPEEVCQCAVDSGLRGRGGAGFPTGKKWQAALSSKNDKKYIICNGDEGDPGAFMDRSVLEGDPHCLIEAMTICGYATGATRSEEHTSELQSR